MGVKGLLAHLKSGNWVTKERLMRVVIIVLSLYTIAISAMIFLSHDGLDYSGRPLGTDFSNVYAAGKMALSGEAEYVYDYRRHYQAQKEVFSGQDVPFFGWHYPPFFLIIAAALALVPYTVSLFIWQFTSLILYLFGVWQISKTYLVKAHFVVLLALAFPAVFINIIHGHTGFLCAALFAAALFCLQQRPLIAGVFFGLLVFKPQFGLFIPLVLLATQNWRAFWSATATVLVFAGLTYAFFGLNVWFAFLDSMALTTSYVLETGATGWHKIQSIFSALRMWGADVMTAYIFQGFLCIVLALSLVLIWCRQLAYELKASALITASLLATPYIMDYDLMLLAPALVFFSLYGYKTGFLAYEKTSLALIWTAPIFARPIADILGMPLGFIIMVVFFGLIMRRSFEESHNSNQVEGEKLYVKA